MEHDFSFTWDGALAPGGPFAHMLVARFEGHEAMSELYRYEILLLVKDPLLEVDPEDLIGKSATLRITTQSEPFFRVVHGSITEAKEAYDGPDGLYYRVTLAPPWARALHRRRCRIFLEKTTRQIIEAVLQGDPKMSLLPDGVAPADDGDPLWSPPEERFTWRLHDPGRVDNPKVRPYCVQYNESDQEFVARLLEEEGISYHIENGRGVCLLVLSDSDAGRSRLDVPFIGPGIDGREVASFQLGARMRPSKVTLGDYNWKNPKTPMTAAAAGDAEGAASDLEHRVYPGGYPDNAGQGAPLAAAALDRFAVEASYAIGEGSLRVLSAGTICHLLHKKTRYEGELLITRVRSRGEQSGVASAPVEPSLGVPFLASFECARRGKGASVEESRFRPAKKTPRPIIAGSQTAVVTAEPKTEGAEVNVGGPPSLSIGCARARFRWDHDEARHAKEPTSCWIRSSQAFAGVAEGAVWHPRVGVEVVVEFEEGNPDRPLITGRVYNGQKLPPYGGAKTLSALKSFATPGGAVWNELTFDDTAGSELFFINAGKDMTTKVGNDRAESVTSYAKMVVGVDNTESVGVNATTTVGANDAMVVGANQSKSIGANRRRDVAANHSKIVGANEARKVGAAQSIKVGGPLTETVGGAVTETYSSVRTTTISGAVSETFSATRDVSVAGLVFQDYGGPHAVGVAGGRSITVGGPMGVLVGGSVTNTYCSPLTTTVGGINVVIAGGGVMIDTPKYTVDAPLKIYVTGISGEIIGAKSGMTSWGATFTGLSLSATACSVLLKKSLTKELKGTSSEVTGIEIDITGLRVLIGGAKVHTCATKVFV